MSSSSPSSAEEKSSRPSTSTSRSLLWRARQHDPVAWEKMVRLYAPLVSIWCRRSGLQDDDAADVFQEVFQAVAVNLNQFKKSRASDTFRGWLRVITQNKIRDRFRKAGREPQAAGGTEAHRWLEQVPNSGAEDSLSERELADVGPGKAELPMDDDESARLVFRQALALIRADFAEHIWNAFWRTAVDGQSSPDVADELGMTPGAVRVAKSRVLQRLREELGDLL